MSHLEKYIINGNLSDQAIQKYLAKELPPNEQHAIEKYLLDHPFEADAIEGLEELENKNEYSSIISDINQKLNQKIGHQPKDSWQWVSGNAASILLLISTSYFFLPSSDMANSTGLAFEQQADTEYKKEQKSLVTPQSQDVTTDEPSIAPNLEDSDPEIELLEERKPESVAAEHSQLAERGNATTSPTQSNTRVAIAQKEEEEAEIQLSEEDFEVADEIVVDSNNDLPTKNGINAKKREAYSIAKSKSTNKEEKTISDQNLSNTRRSLTREATPVNDLPIANDFRDKIPFEKRDGYQLYAMKEYESAVSFLEDYLRKKPNDVTLNYILAISYLELNQPRAAYRKLSNIKKKDLKEVDLKKALKLLEEGKIQEALTTLDQYFLMNRKLVAKP